jgi:ferric-chelate reductase (NADPH)
MRIKSTLLKWLTHTATVADVSDPSEHFRLLTLQSDSFNTKAATLGDKIRVVIGGSLLRTYTPFDWNSSQGTARLLAYRRAEGVASQWLGSLRRGDSCQLLGPQRSTPLSALQRPAIFIGDETSFALARSLQSTAGGSSDVKFLFEVSSAVKTEPLLAAIGIREDSLVERTEGESHLEFLNRQLMELMISNDQQRPPPVCIQRQELDDSAPVEVTEENRQIAFGSDGEGILGAGKASPRLAAR